MQQYVGRLQVEVPRGLLGGGERGSRLHFSLNKVEYGENYSWQFILAFRNAIEKAEAHL